MDFLSASDHFILNGKEIQITVSDFWKWSFSDPSNESCRSAMAEYIIASSLHKAMRPKSSRQFYGIVTDNGIKIDIRSAAYVQSIDGEHPDAVSFSISPNVTINEPIGNKWLPDIFIFCLFRGMMPDDSLINLDLWEFYVIREKDLSEKKQQKKTITLQSLKRLEPVWSDYNGICEAINTVMSA